MKGAIRLDKIPSKEIMGCVEQEPKKKAKIVEPKDTQEMFCCGMLCPPKPSLRKRRIGEDATSWAKYKKSFNKEVSNYHKVRSRILIKDWKPRTTEEIKVFCNRRLTEASDVGLSYNTRIGTKYREISVGSGGMSVDKSVVLEEFEEEAQQTFGHKNFKRSSPKYNKHNTRETYEVDKKRLRRMFKDSKISKKEYEEKLGQINWEDKNQLTLFKLDEDTEELEAIEYKQKPKTILRSVEMAWLEMFERMPMESMERSFILNDEGWKTFLKLMEVAQLLREATHKTIEVKYGLLAWI